MIELFKHCFTYILYYWLISCVQLTRADAIVGNVNLTKNYGSSNVIECARQWNIKILHIDGQFN